MPKKAVVLLAEGFEEVEAVTPIDYLRRAGIEVSVVSVSDNLIVKGSRNIEVKAETALSQLPPGEYDAVIVPGGLNGSKNIAASSEAGALLKKTAEAGKLICAICAAPALVLSPLGLLKGKNFTCYPGMEKEAQDGVWKEERVVIDRNLITSRGAGTAGEFAIAIIEKLTDEETSKKIAESVLL